MHSTESAHAAHEYAETLLCAAREPMLALTPDLRIIGASGAFWRVFAIRPTEAQGALPYQLEGGRWDTPRLRELLETVLAHEERVSDFQVILREPRQVLHLNACRIKGGSEFTELIVLGIGDITGYVDGTTAADPAAYRLSAIISTSEDAIVSKGLDGIITSWNPAAERMFGFTAEEAVGNPITIIIPPERRAEEEYVLGRLRAGHAIEHFETVRVRKDGTSLDVSLTVSPIRDLQGRIVGASKIARDITEQKRAQQEITENHRRLHALVDALPAAVYTTDAQGRVTMYNQAAVRLAGRTPRIGQDAWCISWKLYRPDGTPLRHDECPMAQALRERRPIRGQELLVERPDGARLACIPYPTPLFDASGKLVGGVNMMIDISDRKRAEEALRESDRNKSEFLGVLAHELRNPLAPISSALAIMGRARLDRERLEELRSMMERQITHMTRLIDDLMDVSRISRRKLTLRLERTELQAVVQMALESVNPTIREAKQALHVEVPDEPVVLRADPTRLTQVVANLLNNASKYSPPQSQITLSARREGDEAVVQVTDNGIGIEPEQIPAVFELFSQLDRSGERGRTGLGVGLTLVRTLVQMHGGTIEAYSEGAGRGSTFIVRLPLGPEEGEAGESEEAAAPPAPLNILVVDDHQIVADLFAELLTELGHTARVASSGSEAIAAIADAKPDVVFSDISMPGMSGFELARRLRSDPALSDLVLVAVSGYGQPEDKQRSLDAGFDHHVVKPATPETLEKLFSVIARRRG